MALSSITPAIELGAKDSEKTQRPRTCASDFIGYHLFSFVGSVVNYRTSPIAPIASMASGPGGQETTTVLEVL
jgi:hypothetical protein